MINIGDRAVECFRSIEGAAHKLNYVGDITLCFADESLAVYFKKTRLADQLNFPRTSINIIEANSSSDYSIDFKLAGRRLGANMKDAKSRFDAGDRTDFLPNEIKKKQRLQGDILAYNDQVRIEINPNSDCEDYMSALNARRVIKKYITEILGIEIVPAVFRSPDDIVGDVRILSIVLVNCSEVIYQALEKYSGQIFANTLFNFRLATRKEIFDGWRTIVHQIENGLTIAIHDKAKGKYI